jgi:hypothetical protein
MCKQWYTCDFIRDCLRAIQEIEEYRDRLRRGADELNLDTMWELRRYIYDRLWVAKAAEKRRLQLYKQALRLKYDNPKEFNMPPDMQNHLTALIEKTASAPYIDALDEDSMLEL